MVSENWKRTRVLQGEHGFKGGRLGDSEKAKKMGALLGGKNEAPRKDSGARVSSLPVKALF